MHIHVYIYNIHRHTQTCMHRNLLKHEWKTTYGVIQLWLSYTASRYIMSCVRAPILHRLAMLVACEGQDFLKSRKSRLYDLRFRGLGFGESGGGVHCFSAKFKALKLETYGDGLGVQGV